MRSRSLDKAQFKGLIDGYIYSGQEPIRDDVFKCLDNCPSILKAREIGERILEKMKEFVGVFMSGCRRRFLCNMRIKSFKKSIHLFCQSRPFCHSLGIR